MHVEFDATSCVQACGAKYQLEKTSFDETDVDDVVVSLVELAKKVFSGDRGLIMKLLCCTFPSSFYIFI